MDALALTDAETAVVLSIIAAPEAWSRRDGFDEACISSLVAAEIVAEWERPDYRAVCLTPIAAVVFGVELEELDHSTIIITEDGRELRKAEEPFWRPLDPRPWGQRETIPYRSPRHPREVPFILVGCQFKDDRPTPTETAVLLDEYSGEPVLLFGRTVPVDARIKGKRRRA